jgi:hypothetical protein
MKRIPAANQWLNPAFPAGCSRLPGYYFGDFRFHGLQFFISPANFH